MSFLPDIYMPSDLAALQQRLLAAAPKVAADVRALLPDVRLWMGLGMDYWTGMAMDEVRGIAGELGLRPFTVTLRVRTWTGERPNIGTKVDNDTVLTAQAA